MKTRALPVVASVIALAVSGPAAQASVTTYFDSLDGAQHAGYYNGPQSAAGSVGGIADSFYAGTPNFSQVTLQLGALTPSDGGSIMVYLVPNTGGSAGVPGLPTFSTSSGGFVGWTGATLLGTVGDSALGAPNTRTNVTFNFSPSEAAALSNANGEYWIGVEFSSGSSGVWYYNTGSLTNTIGETSQITFGASSVGSGSSTFPDTDGTFDLIVSTPEPASLALLGGAVAGFGYLRRRRGKKTA